MTTPRVETELLDWMRPGLVTLVTENSKRLAGLQHCDLRMSIKEEKGAVAENGSEKASSEDYTFDFGVRVIAGGRIAAPELFRASAWFSGCFPHRTSCVGWNPGSTSSGACQRPAEECCPATVGTRGTEPHYVGSGAGRNSAGYRGCHLCS